ncbi:hypothetical protein BH10ACT10_BH10ACT10_01930 [soil metagenome]
MSPDHAPRAGLSRRRLIQGTAAAVTLGVGGTGVGLLTQLGESRDETLFTPRADRPVFGMLQAESSMYDELKAAGVAAVAVSVSWSQAQPADGDLDAGYLDQVVEELNAADAAGLYVSLSPGLQYPPEWVKGLPDSRFVDQQGVAWAGPVGDDIVDGVFNLSVRDTQQRYLEALGVRLGDLHPAAVRIGGLGRGELHYPPVDRSGARDTFWAYSVPAQEQCPVPGYRPGQGSPDDASTFLEWYLDALRDYGRWQVDLVREHFGSRPRLLVLLPSWGVRPGEIDAAVAAGLDGSTSGQQRGTLAEGVDWERQLVGLAGVDGVDACTTWLDARDQGADPADESPVHFLSRMASRNGFDVWAENTGDNTAKDMARCVGLVRGLGLRGLFWMSADRLGRDGNARLSDYRGLVHE